MKVMKMKAAVVKAFGQPLEIQEVLVPEVTPGKVLVKIAATGVCHTDLHAAEGDWPVKPNPPFIPGHEGVGHVVAVGQGVTHIKEGIAWACRGSIPPAGTANTVSGAGKRFVTASKTQAIRLTAALPSIVWQTPIMWASCRITSSLPISRRSSVRG